MDYIAILEGGPLDGEKLPQTSQDGPEAVLRFQHGETVDYADTLAEYVIAEGETTPPGSEGVRYRFRDYVMI